MFLNIDTLVGKNFYDDVLSWEFIKTIIHMHIHEIQIYILNKTTLKLYVVEV